MGLVGFAINRFYPSYVGDDDMFQAGCIGLCVASKKFDRNKGVEFATFAVPCIRNELTTHYRKNSLNGLQNKVDMLSIDYEASDRDGATLESVVAGQPGIESTLAVEEFVESHPVKAQQVCQLLVEGLNTTEISQMMGISTGYISTLKRLLKKEWYYGN